MLDLFLITHINLPVFKNEIGTGGGSKVDGF
jgi:hypothetical protein